MSEKADSLTRAYNSQSAAEVKSWISALLGESLPGGDLIETLQDGVILCR